MLRSSSDVGDPCELLGVGPNATDHDITTAFRKASLKVHPDRCPDDPDAAAKFRKLTMARDLLLDRSKSRRSLFGSGRPKDVGVSWVVTTQSRSSSSTASATPVDMTTKATSNYGSVRSTSSTSAPSAPFTFSVSSAGCSKTASASTSTPPVWSWTPPLRASSKRTSTSFSSTTFTSTPCSKIDSFAQEGEENKGASRVEKGKTKRCIQRESPKETPTKMRNNKAHNERRFPFRRMLARRHETEKSRCKKRTQNAVDDENATNKSRKFLEELSEVSIEGEEQANPSAAVAWNAQPLTGLRCCLEDATLHIAEMPFENRSMLADVCDLACEEARRTAVDERHEFLTSVLEMIDELLAAVADARRSNAKAAIQEAKVAAANVDKFASFDNDCRKIRVALQARLEENDDQRERLDALKDELAMAVESEKLASSRASAAAISEKSCMGEKSVAESALLSFQAMEANGPPSKVVDAKKKCKEIEIQMTVMNVHKTLFPRVANTVVPALMLVPESRSRSDEGALAAAEGCFTSYIQEKTDELVALTASAVACHEETRRAKVEVDRVRQAIDTCNDAIKNGKAEHKTLDSALEEAERNRKQHNDQVASLVQAAKEFASTLKAIKQTQKHFRDILVARYD